MRQGNIARNEKATAAKSIPNLLQMVTENKLCVPSFQREFVWTPTQIAKLMDSIVRHYPIGTLMLLKKEGNPNLGAEAFLDSDDGDFNPQFYVIDGQQSLKKYFIPPEILESRPTFREFTRARRRLPAKKVALLLRNGE